LSTSEPPERQTARQTDDIIMPTLSAVQSALNDPIFSAMTSKHHV